MKLGILKGFNPNDEQNYENACKDLNIDYKIINFMGDNWLDEIKNSNCDGFLARPPCDILERKSAYDERLYFLNKIMHKKLYPSFDELYIYENKRNMYTWLSLNNYSHAKTNIFFKKEDALAFVRDAKYPMITKSNIGASGDGVHVLKKPTEAKKFINWVFGSVNGALAIGISPKSRKYKIPVPLIGRSQKHFALFQEWIDIKWEWRIIKIGDSYFGYKKLLGKNGLASGNNLDGWGKPPKELLFMVKELCDKGKFLSMAVDIFEGKDDQYYINELQTIFGAYNPSQMYIDDKPCRYKFIDGEFVLEEGYFCQNGCANLRVEHFSQLLS